MSPSQQLGNAELRETHLVTYIAYSLLVILVGLLCLSKIYEDDVFWQLATGRWIVQHHVIPATDVFGFVTKGQPWIQYEWLWCTVMYVAYTASQSYGTLEIITALICGGMIAIQFLTMHRLRIATPISLLLAVLVICNAIGRLVPRPYIVTMLGLAVTIYFVYHQRFQDRAKSSIIYLLPLVFLVWANVHPGVMAGLVVLGIAIVSELLRLFFTLLPESRALTLYQDNNYLKTLVLVFFLCACAMLINPQDINTYLAMAHRTQSTFWSKITEWDSPFSPNVNMVQLWFYKTLLLTGSVSIYYSWKKRDPLPALLYVAFALYSVRAVRLRVDYAAVTVPGTALALQYCAERFGKSWVLKLMRGRILTYGFMALAGVAICSVPTGLLYSRMNVNNEFGLGLDSTALPIPMMDFMKREQISGRPFNERGVGGMLVWEFVNEKNFIDGRDLNDEIVKEYSAMYQLSDGFEKKYEQYGIDHVVIFVPGLEKNAELIMTSPVPYFSTHRDEWKLVFWDDRSYLYLKNLPRFQREIEQYEYKTLHPYLFAYCPSMFDSLCAALPVNVRQELMRKLAEEPRGRVIQFIANVVENHLSF